MAEIANNENSIQRYLNNLDQETLKFIAKQLIMYPESRLQIVKAINEFTKFYNFSIKEGSRNDTKKHT